MNDDQRRFGSGEPSSESTVANCQHGSEKLAFENRILRAVLDSMPDNISIKDLQGRYVFDNSSHCRFLGATNIVEVVGKTVFDFLPANVAAKFHAEDLRVVQTGVVVQSVDETVDVVGNKVWMSVTKMPLRDDNGELIGLVSTTRDTRHHGAKAGGRTIGCVFGGTAREKCTVGRGPGDCARTAARVVAAALPTISKLCFAGRECVALSPFLSFVFRSRW